MKNNINSYSKSNGNGNGNDIVWNCTWGWTGMGAGVISAMYLDIHVYHL